MNLDFNIAALLCYAPLCCINVIFAIVFLVQEPKQNAFVRFHAAQSLALMAASIIVNILLQTLSAIGGRIASPIGMLFGMVTALFGLAVLALTIICMIKSYKNEGWKIPVLGDLAEKWAA